MDVHTYTRTRPPPGWGPGLNIILLHDDAVQKRAAQCFADALERRCPKLSPKIIVMPRRTENIQDDNANAMIEWSRANGAMSFLFEFPVDMINPHHTASDESWALSAGMDASQIAQGVCDALEDMGVTRRYQ